MPETESASQPTPGEDSHGSRSAPLNSAWTKLKQQRSEHARRSEVLDTLRQRLSKHLDKQNRVLLDRQRALDVRRLQNDRERVYLRDARLHFKRTQKEQDETLERRSRQVEQQTETIEAERATLSEELQLTRDNYEKRIDGLLLEKETMADRLQDLEQRAAGPPTVEPSTPPAAPTARLGEWRLGVAILTGIIGIAALFLSSQFEYRVEMTLVGDDRTTAQDLDHHRSELARALAVFEWPTPPRLEVRPDDSALQVAVQTPQTAATRQALHDHVETHLSQLGLRRQERRSALQQELKTVTADLVQARNDFDHLVTQLADQELSVEVDNPREELQRLRGSLADARQRYDAVRDAIDASSGRVDHLLAGAVPQTPPVDPQVLQTATKRDTQLHQDAEELRFHLNRQRKHLLETFVEFPQRIEAFAGSAQRFSTYLETRRLDIRNTMTLEILDTLRQESERLARLIVEFEREWSKAADRLQRLAVDPHAPRTPEIARQAEDLVENLNHEANAILQTLQAEYQKYLRGLDSRAEHFQLTSEIKDGMLDIQKMQYRFMTLASRIRPRSDIQLEAIVHRVDGLARRVGDRRKAIIAELQTQQRETLSQQRSESVEGEQVRLTDLQQQRQAVLDEMMHLQDQLTSLIPYVEEHGITTTVVRYTKAEGDALQKSISDLQERETTITRQLARLQGPASTLTIAGSRVGAWPSNGLKRLANIATAGMALAFVVYIILMLIPARTSRETAPLAG